ncbi:MAG: FixH family protein [Bradymonadia bacterium]
MLRLLSLLILLTGIGCGTESDSHHHHGHHDHMGHGGDPSKDDADTYVAGLEKVGTSGHLTIRLIESAPTVLNTGVYTWQLMVIGSDGQPMNGLNIQAEPTMPDHGHGTEPRYTEGTPTDEDGIYELKDMDLYMKGVWQVMVRISSTEGVEDSVAFSFYLEDAQ